MSPRLGFRVVQRLVNLLNRMAPSGDESERPEDLYANIYDDVIDRHLARMGGTALEIVDGGCGSGRMAVRLAQSGHHVTGIELHRGTAEAARKRALAADVRIALREGDLLDELRELPPEGTDVALCLEVLYTCVHFRDILAEFARILRPGGLILASFRPPWYFITALLRRGNVEKALRVSRTREGVLRLATVPTYYNWQTEEEVATLYDELGIEVVEQRSIGTFSGTDYDGMGGVLDIATLEAPSARAALLELEGAPGPVRNAGRYHLCIGRKR